MRQVSVGSLLLLCVGCSNAPIAGLLDWAFPSKRPANAMGPYGTTPPAVVAPPMALPVDPLIGSPGTAMPTQPMPTNPATPPNPGTLPNPDPVPFTPTTEPSRAAPVTLARPVPVPVPNEAPAPRP